MKIVKNSLWLDQEIDFLEFPLTTARARRAAALPSGGRDA